MNITGSNMTTSKQPVILVPNVWVDLYAETGITVGAKIIVQNNGSITARLSESVGEPISTTGYNSIAPFKFLTSADTPVGAWAYCTSNARLQVEEA